MCLLVIWQLCKKTPGEAGKIMPGTPAPAPAGPMIRRKMKLTTRLAVAIWIPCAAILLSGVVTDEDSGVFGRLATLYD